MGRMWYSDGEEAVYHVTSLQLWSSSQASMLKQ